MSNEFQNPYSPPSAAVEPVKTTGGNIPFEPGDEKKVEAVVKDASQWWLAIILCILCSAIGAIIVPIWYTIRLIQWYKYSSKYPQLMDPNAPAGMLSARFQSSNWKLIVGLVIGCVILLLVLLNVLMLIAMSPV